MSEGDIPEFMTMAEVMRRLQVSKNTAYSYVKEGLFGDILRLGDGPSTDIRVSVEGFREFCNKRMETPSPKGYTITKQTGEHNDVHKNRQGGQDDLHSEGT